MSLVRYLYAQKIGLVLKKASAVLTPSTLYARWLIVTLVKVQL